MISCAASAPARASVGNCASSSSRPLRDGITVLMPRGRRRGRRRSASDATWDEATPRRATSDQVGDVAGAPAQHGERLHRERGRDRIQVRQPLAALAVRSRSRRPAPRIRAGAPPRTSAALTVERQRRRRGRRTCGRGAIARTRPSVRTRARSRAAGRPTRAMPSCIAAAAARVVGARQQAFQEIAERVQPVHHLAAVRMAGQEIARTSAASSSSTRSYGSTKTRRPSLAPGRARPSPTFNW